MARQVETVGGHREPAARAFGGGAQAAAAGTEVAVRHPEAAAVACAKRDGGYEHCGKRCR